MEILERLKKMTVESTTLKESGVQVIRWGYGTAPALRADDRYKFDFEYCTSKLGWKQYDTHQDASYFGVWVNLKKRTVLCYCEGDLNISIAHNDEELKAELDYMAEFYGDPPPAFKSIDTETGQVTNYYDERPKVTA